MKKLILLLFIVSLCSPVIAAKDVVTETTYPVVELPEIRQQTVEGFTAYFTRFFTRNNYDVRGLAKEAENAAYAAMSILYIEDQLGRPLTYEELLAGVWFSEVGSVWAYDEEHPLVIATKEAIAHQLNSYCGGIGIVSCDIEYVLLALGSGWQAFRYNIDTHGVLTENNNIVIMLQSDLKVHIRVREIGIEIIELASTEFDCASAWTVGILPTDQVYKAGDAINIGYVAWAGYLPTSVGAYANNQYAVINSCGIRLK